VGHMVVALVGTHMPRNTAAGGGLVSQNTFTEAPARAGTITRASIRVFWGGSHLLPSNAVTSPRPPLAGSRMRSWSRAYTGTTKPIPTSEMLCTLVDIEAPPPGSRPSGLVAV